METRSLRRALASLALFPVAVLCSCGSPVPPMSTTVTLKLGVPGDLIEAKMAAVEVLPNANQTQLIFTETPDGSSCTKGEGLKLTLYVIINDNGRGVRGPGSYAQNTGDGVNTPYHGYRLELHRFAAIFNPADGSTSCVDDLNFGSLSEVGTIDFATSDLWGATGSFNLSRTPAAGETSIADIQGSFSAPIKNSLLSF